MEGIIADFKPLEAQAPFEGPIPLRLALTNDGEDEVRVPDAAHWDITFQPPQGWKLRELPGLRQAPGFMTTTTLAKGQSLSHTIYLHDYFSAITPGDAQLPITVKMNLITGATAQSVVLTETCFFQVTDPDPKLFEARIRQIHSQINQERSAEKRLELYRSIQSLSHPELIPLFIQSLLDAGVLVFHFTARARLVDLCEAYGNRGPIISHLINCGARYDAAFFSMWKERQVELAGEEITRLSEASGVWTRLLALENYEGQHNRESLIESLKSEIEELAERARRLG